jgi:hypothetical protein
MFLLALFINYARVALLEAAPILPEMQQDAQRDYRVILVFTHAFNTVFENRRSLYNAQSRVIRT